MDQLSLKIEAMGCQACVARVTKAIQKIQGARPISVSVGHATVELDPTRTSADAVIEAVTKAGYPASEEAS